MRNKHENKHENYNPVYVCYGKHLTNH